MSGFQFLSLSTDIILEKMSKSNRFPSESRIVSTSAVIPATKWNARDSHDIPHGTDYYLKCAAAGLLACGVTHPAMTPLDVAKCNMQVNPIKYKGLINTVKTILAEEGSVALIKGWLPTAIGYSAQGCFKYGLYEYFKDFYSTLAGEENAHKYRGFIYLAGAATAEAFADIALCPMEMVKVKVQTSVPGTFPTAFGAAVKAMSADATSGFPYRSLVPLWSRQIPYTMAKFFFFEMIKEQFYTNIFTAPKASYSNGTHLGITFASGYIAGIACAIVSHPADTIVSKMSKSNQTPGGAILKELGFRGIWGGLPTRILMIGTLTGLQWWIYDSVKTGLGINEATAH
jgi:solute carrier family 25 phosphate transporter 3